MVDDAQTPLWEGLIAILRSGGKTASMFTGPSSRDGQCAAWLPARRLWPAGLVILSFAVSVVSVLPDDSAGQSRETYLAGENGEGTPVSVEQDPLDGLEAVSTRVIDPLDGAPEGSLHDDVEAPEEFDELPVVRSGRSRTAPDSSVAYDGDHKTAWPAGELENRWVWFDLGESSRLRELRWATIGTGSLTIEVSDDREKWQEIGEASLAGGWSGLTLREDAQFVQLTFSDETSDDAALIEFAVYGVRLDKGGGGSPAVDLAQEEKQRASARKDRRSKGERRAQRADNDAPAAEVDSNDDASSSGIQISAKPGKTKCKGDKARCRANEGKTRVAEDCATEGTCVIDVRADGGTAICDASGGDSNETGQGEGKQPGRGGRCEATANGGTVTIGDINP